MAMSLLYRHCVNNLVKSSTTSQRTLINNFTSIINPYMNHLQQNIKNNALSITRFKCLPRQSSRNFHALQIPSNTTTISTAVRESILNGRLDVGGCGGQQVRGMKRCKWTGRMRANASVRKRFLPVEGGQTFIRLHVGTKKNMRKKSRAQKVRGRKPVIIVQPKQRKMIRTMYMDTMGRDFYVSGNDICERGTTVTKKSNKNGPKYGPNLQLLPN